MKKYSQKQLHDNYIMLTEYMYGPKSVKEWVRADKTQVGTFHTDWDSLMPIVQEIYVRTKPHPCNVSEPLDMGA